MFGLGTPELLVIFGIAFLVFGGKKLPELGAGLGKGIRSFKTGLKDVEATGKTMINEHIPGAQEVSSIKEQVNEIKSFAKN